MLVFIILPAIEVRAVLQYLSTLLRHSPTTIDFSSPTEATIAFALLATITLVNLYGAKVTGMITKGVVFFKLMTPLLICVVFLYALGHERALDPNRLGLNPSGFSSIPWIQIFQAIATSGIIFSFNGFNQATFFAGETKNPQKAIPFAIFGSLLLSASLYLALQYVFIMAVPAESLAHGWQNISFPGDHGPFAGLAEILDLGGILSLIYLDAVLSPLGTAFTYASAAPRLLYSLSEGSSWEISQQKLNRYGISQTHLGVTLILQCLAYIFLPNLQAMIALLVAAFVLCYTVAPASLLVLRKSEPHLKRPFRVKWAWGACYLSIFFSNLMVFSCGWTAIRNLMVFSAAFLLFYLMMVARKKANVNLQQLLQKSGWFVFQILALGGLAFFHAQAQLKFEAIFICVATISLLALIAGTLGDAPIGSADENHRPFR